MRRILYHEQLLLSSNRRLFFLIVYVKVTKVADRAEKRLRMRAVDSFWRIFDRLISTLNDVVPVGDSLAITSFDKMELDEF